MILGYTLPWAICDAWSGGLLDSLDAQHHVVCPVCMPPGRGDSLCVFAPCFAYSM